MTQMARQRFGLGLAVALGLAPVLLGQPETGPAKKAPEKTQTFTGNIVPLGDRLEKFGARLDPEAASHWLALVTKDGKVYPLIEDDGARLFFQDKSLRNRPMRLTGRLFADTHLLQVLSVNSIRQGKLYDVYYWCDICSIRRRAPGKCECCGGPMQLREEPVK
jgi:hypothetical protein